MARHISRPYATAKRDRGGGTCGGVASNRANFCIQRAVLAGRTRSSSTWLCFPWRYVGEGRGPEIIDRTSKTMVLFRVDPSSPLCRRVARVRAHSIEPRYRRPAAFRVVFPFFPHPFSSLNPRSATCASKRSHFPRNKKGAATARSSTPTARAASHSPPQKSIRATAALEIPPPFLLHRIFPKIDRERGGRRETERKVPQKTKSKTRSLIALIAPP